MKKIEYDEFTIEAMKKLEPDAIRRKLEEDKRILGFTDNQKQKTLINKFLRADQLTEVGYYWWLPECFKDKQDFIEYWSIISWDPRNKERQKAAGHFVGPLSPPTRKG